MCIAIPFLSYGRANRIGMSPLEGRKGFRPEMMLEIGPAKDQRSVFLSLAHI
jgi:hypothetical protein